MSNANEEHRTSNIERYVLSIILSAIASSRNPTAPRQNPTGSSRNVWWVNAVIVPTVNASAASPINAQQMLRMAAIIIRS